MGVTGYIFLHPDDLWGSFACVSWASTAILRTKACMPCRQLDALMWYTVGDHQRMLIVVQGRVEVRVASSSEFRVVCEQSRTPRNNGRQSAKP